MVQRCCVPFCNSKVGDKDTRGVKLQFHRIRTKSKEWRNAITDNQTLLTFLPPGSRVCSKHFTEQDYLKSATSLKHIPKHCSVNTTLKGTVSYSAPQTRPKRLKPEAVPTVFQWSVPKEHLYAPHHSPIADSKMAQTDSSGQTDITSRIEFCSCSEDTKPCAEIVRKNTIIRQLLTRIEELELAEKSLSARVAELKDMNDVYLKEIRELIERNANMEFRMEQRVLE